MTAMKLEDHKRLLLEYEELLRELADLRAVKPSDEWIATVRYSDFIIQLQPDCAQKLLHDRLRDLENNANDIAARLAITVDG
jgi:hypothetical protein